MRGDRNQVTNFNFFIKKESSLIDCFENLKYIYIQKGIRLELQPDASSAHHHQFINHKLFVPRSLFVIFTC
jgi:hypothetical protein